VAAARRGALEAALARAEARPRRWLIALGLLPALQISAMWYATLDGVAYLSIARRLAAGAAPMRLGDAQLGYPLGYPLIISPAFLTGARPWLVLAVLHYLLAVVLLLGVQRWARQRLGAAGIWVTALVMVNVNVWILYRRTLSEAAFCAVMIWTVLALDRLLGTLADGDAARRSLAAASLVAVPLLILLTAVREVGLLFAAGFAVALGARVWRGALAWRAALPALAAVAMVGGVAIGVVRPERLAAAGPAFAGRLVGYADAATAVDGSLGERLRLRVTEIGQLLVPGMFKAYGDGWLDLNQLVFVPLCAAVAFGWWALWRRGADVLTATAPLYLGVYLAWPYAGGTRYLLPLLPLFWACVWEAGAPLRRRRTTFALLAVAHLGVALGYLVVIDAPRARACDRHWPTVDRLAARIAAAGGAVTAAGVPSCVRLMFELSLDRPVREARAGEAVAPDTIWLLTPQASAAVDGFVPSAADGDYAVARRR